MLLDGRFGVLRLYLPVRVTSVIDERRYPDQRVWGFSYETVRGHLERGRLTYEVIKHERTGDVEFAITAHSQRAPSVGPILRLGWSLFGRQRQLLFYRRCAERSTTLAREATRHPGSRGQPDPMTGLRFAFFDAPVPWLDRITLHSKDPG